MAGSSSVMAATRALFSSPKCPRSIQCGAEDPSSASSSSGFNNVKLETPQAGFKLGLESVKRQHKLRCECHDLFEELVPYVGAWKWQKEIVDGMCAAVQRGEEPSNSVILLQHPPVYTMGTRSSDKFLRFDKDHPPCELHRTERGGEITYHGPGQLVMYPLLNLRDHKMDLHWYMRMLEEVVIRTLWAACGLQASRVDGLTGVWVGDAKVAAIGVRVSRWITYHGLALNVTTDLAPFQNIVPCGIADRPVGSINQVLNFQEQKDSFTPPTANNLLFSSAQGTQRQSYGEEMKSNILESTISKSGQDDSMLLRCVHDMLLVKFADLFQVELVPPTRRGPQTLSNIYPQLHASREEL